MGPIGAARVGYINGEYVLNPTTTELKQTQLNLVVAGTQHAVLMVESEAMELSEDIMLGAVTVWSSRNAGGDRTLSTNSPTKRESLRGIGCHLKEMQLWPKKLLIWLKRICALHSD